MLALRNRAATACRCLTRFREWLPALILLSAAPLLAQNAELSGLITDPSGLAVPNAKVSVQRVGTGAARTVSSNQQGEYSVPALLPGPYNITIEATRFKAVHQNGVVVEVDQHARVDFALTIGSTTETVTVQGSASLHNTSDASVSTIIDPRFVDNIPLNGRSFQTLIMLTPGVVVTPTTYDDQGQFSVNGQRADANYFMVDGVSANFGVTGYTPLVQAAGGALPALSVSGGTNSLVSVDAMQEFRVQTSSFAPEFGRTPGGQISIVTRSGTNDLHGTLFEYFRNSVLDARDWFVNYNNLPKPAERQNDFGGVFGGPIIKDKTFFFFSYEGLRLRQPETQETAVPDNPARRQATAAVQPFLNAYPVPNGPEIGAGLAQFNASYSNPSSLDAYSIRIDHAVKSRVHLFGRYNYSPSDLTQRGAQPGTTPVLSMTESLSSSIQTGTVGLNQIITPRISNEIRANYSNDRVGAKYSLDDFGGAVPLPNSLIFPPGYSSANAILNFVLPGPGTYYDGDYGVNEQRQINFIDNLSVLEKSHQLKFGVDYRWLSVFSTPFGYNQLLDFLGVQCSSPPCPGYAVSGKSAVAAIFAYQSDTLIAKNLSLYVQDTWRITPRLTMTYGLRWDLNPPLKGKDLANQPFTVTGLDNPATIGLAPRGTPLYQTTYHNVAPRVGLAYQMVDKLKWRTVLRGGFGIFYDLGYGSLGGASYSFPFEALKVIPGASLPLSPANAAPPQFTTGVPVNGTMDVAEPNLKLPRTYEWNIAVEQSLGNRQLLSLTYVGSAGHDLLRVTPLLNPNPNFPFIDVTSNTASSNYQGLQVKFERRLSQGLQLLSSYTWSHSIDNASTDAYATYLNTPNFIGSPSIDRASSDFDIGHAFTSGLTYSLPTPGSNQLGRSVLGGWSVDSFAFARSATPVDVVAGLVYTDGVALHPRPNVKPGVPIVLYSSSYPGGKIFNSAAFSAPPIGQQGGFGRNVLRGFGAWQADVAIQRQFALTDKVGLRFRAELFNLFNHANFGPPDNVLTDALFGRSTQTLAGSLGSGGANGGVSPLYQIGGPRSIQLALKLVF